MPILELILLSLRVACHLGSPLLGCHRPISPSSILPYSGPATAWHGKLR